MTIDNPVQLVNEFKKSGEFERLRQELLRKIMDGQGMDTLTKGVSDVARQELARDPKLSFMSSDAIYKEIMDNIDRFPVVDRVVLQSLYEPSFTENIRGSVEKMLLEHKEQKALPLADRNEGSVITSATPSTSPSMEPASGPAVVVTPATPFSGNGNISVPPPIATREGIPDHALEALETEKPSITATTDTKPNLSTLPTTGTDEGMSDETQTQANATSP